MNKELANKVQSKLWKMNLKKKDFTIKVVDTRRYPDTTFSWVNVEVRGKVYDVKEPYCGTRNTDEKNSILFDVLMEMEREYNKRLNIN